MTEDTLMPRSVHLEIITEVRVLLERALFDLDQDWPAAAYDCLGRALRLLPDPNEEIHHGD